MSEQLSHGIPFGEFSLSEMSSREQALTLKNLARIAMDIVRNSPNVLSFEKLSEEVVKVSDVSEPDSFYAIRYGLRNGFLAEDEDHLTARNLKQ